MLDAEKLRRHILADLDLLHDLILRYAAGDRSVRQARDWLEEQVWREVEVLRQVAGKRGSPLGITPRGPPRPECPLPPQFLLICSFLNPVISASCCERILC
jgi:hypothetical protein